MADPLSVSASIAGLISLADIVYSRTLKYWKAVNSAERDVKALADQTSVLAGTLKRLTMLADALADHEATDSHFRMHHISACGHTLGGIKERLKKAQSDFEKPNALSKLQRKLKWPFSADEMKDLLQELARHQSQVQLALAADSTNGILRALARQEDLILSQERNSEMIKKSLEISLRIEVDSRRLKVLDYFQKPTANPQSNFETSLQLRYPLTGLWIRHYPDFQNWLNIPQSHIWLSGLPGVGKTVLAGTVIEEALQSSSATIAVAYFYCDHRVEDSKRPNNILATMACQISQQKEEAFDVLRQYFDELHPSNGLYGAPSTTGLIEVLEDMTQLFDQVLLVVDGVDECGTSTDEVLSILTTISALPNSSMAILSRDEGNIRDCLKGFTEIEIQAKTKDVELYVAGEMELRPRLRNLSPDMKEEILQCLRDGADGMFRWVTCQLDYLCELSTNRQRRDALRKLPPSLPESYLRILKNVSESQSELVEMTLHFIAFSEPQLTINELCEAVSVSGEDDTLDRDDYIHADEITRACSSLLRKTKDGKYLEFSHFSVRQFLQSNFSTDSTLARYKISQARAQRLLACQCLMMLQVPNFQRSPLVAGDELEDVDKRMTNHAFYKYAAFHWMKYERSHGSDPEVARLSRQLFQPTYKGVFTAWAVSLFTQIERLSKGVGNKLYHDHRFEYKGESDSVESDEPITTRSLDIQVLNGSLSPLRIASILGLSDVCAFLLQVVRPPSAKKTKQSLLLDAVSGPEALVAPSSVYSSCNYCAQVARSIRRDMGLSSTWSYHTVRRILDAPGINTTDYGVDYRELIFEVFRKCPIDAGYLQIAASLFSRSGAVDREEVEAFAEIQGLGIDQDRTKTESSLRVLITTLNPPTFTSDNALELCKLAWQEAIGLGLGFVRDPSIVDTRISLSFESLEETIWSSIKNNEPEILRKALQDPRLVSPEVTDEDMQARLSLAVSLGTSEIVKELLHSPFFRNSNTFKDYARMLRTWASLGAETDSEWAEKERILDLLLEHGASTSAQGGPGSPSAWHYSAGDLRTFKLLVQRSDAAQIQEGLSSINCEGFTPITLAMRMRGKSCAAMIRHCTDDPKYWMSPEPIFNLAAAFGSTDVVQAMLSVGLEPTTLQAGGGTPLHFLSPSAEVGCVKTLKAFFPGACKLRFRNRLPIEHYIACCIFSELNGNSVPVQPAYSIMEELIDPEAFTTISYEGWTLWEAICHNIVVRLHENGGHSVTQTGAANFAVSLLLSKGAMESYEGLRKSCGLIPLLEMFESISRGSIIKRMQDWDAIDADEISIERELTYPLGPDTFIQAQQATKYWDEVRTTTPVTLLLQIALFHSKYRRDYAALAKHLLEQGVDPNQRISLLSPLEFVLRTGWVEEDCFRTMMQLTDRKHLNDFNPSTNMAPIHFLSFQTGFEAPFMLELLLDFGADPNLREGSWPFRSVLCLLLESSCSKLSHLLLQRGADVNIATDKGDAALSAVRGGDVTFLRTLHSGGSMYPVNWQSSCKMEMLYDKKRCHERNALHVAASGGDLDIVIFYLANKHLDIDSVSDRSFTALHYAAMEGHHVVVAYLCGNGAQVNLKTKDGDLPLHLAVESNNYMSVNTILKHGSEMTQGAAGMDPLCLALFHSCDPLIINLLRTHQQTPGAEIITEEALSEEGKISLLGSAIQNDDIETCKKIHRLGCSLDGPLDSQKYGFEQPLIQAISLGRVHIVEWLLRQGAPITPSYDPKDRRPRTALEVAVKKKDLNPLLPLLLDAGLNAKENWLCLPFNPLVLALNSSNLEAVRIIIDKVSKNRERYSEIFKVSSYMAVQAVIGHHQTYQHGYFTALHHAVQMGHVDMVALFLDHDTFVDSRDSQNQTPLSIAAKSRSEKSLEIMALLIGRRCTIDAEDTEGLTPLLHGCCNGNAQAVSILLDNGANHETRSIDGSNALHYTFQSLLDNGDRQSIAFQLLQKGLDPLQLNNEGYASLHYALDTSRPSFVFNRDLKIEKIPPYPYYFWTRRLPRPWLTQLFHVFRRRVPEERFKQLVRHEPGKPWSPLCRMAAAGEQEALANIISLGEDPDAIGSPNGTALMAACAYGRLEAVKILVRQGARIDMTHQLRRYSAVESAKSNGQILRWLLVERHLEQKRLANFAATGDCVSSLCPWGGMVQKQVLIEGGLGRKNDESMKAHVIRLASWKKSMRGKVHS